MLWIQRRNLKKAHLVLDGSVDLIEGGHSRELLRDLLIVGPLLWVLTKLRGKNKKFFFHKMIPDLVLVVLEVLSPLLHLLGELGLQLGGLLGVVDLQVEVDAGGDDNELGIRGQIWRANVEKPPTKIFSLEASPDELGNPGESSSLNV